MLDRLVFSLERLPSLVAALVLLGLALWLLWFDFETRLHRAFALLLILKAFFVGLFAFGTSIFDLAMVLRVYFAIGIPFAAVYFALVLRHNYASGTPAAARLGPWAIGLSLAAATFVVLYAVRPELYRTAQGSPGPIGLFFPLAYAAFVFIAFLLFRMARTHGVRERGKALLLVGLGLSLEPLYQVTYHVLSIPVWLTFGWYPARALLDHPFFGLERSIWVLTAVLLVTSVVGLARASRRGDPPMERHSRWVFIALLLPAFMAVLSNLAVVSDQFLGSEIFIDLHVALDALWVVAGAGIIIYAILNHHFIDTRHRVRRAVRTSTVIGALLLFFFVAKELLEEVLEGYYPVLPGLAAAVIAVLLLQPILFIVARFVRSVIPAERALAELKEHERRAVYRHQVEVVWMDGVVTRKERSMLDRMRQRLHLPEELAQRIEAEVMVTVQPAVAPPESEEGGRSRSRSPAR